MSVAQDPHLSAQQAGWVRFAGLLVVIVAALGQMLFLVAFPLWSLLTIGLIVAAIHALTVHGQAFGR